MEKGRAEGSIMKEGIVLGLFLTGRDKSGGGHLISFYERMI